MSTLALFEEKQVRLAWTQAEGEWYIAIVDDLDFLTGSDNPTAYWRVMKKRLSDEENKTVTNGKASKGKASKLTAATCGSRLISIPGDLTSAA